MDIEFYLWGLLPALIGLFVLIKSIQITLKTKTFLFWLFAIIVFLIVGVSEVILFEVFIQDAWPTFIPHLLIGIVIILLGLQFLIYKRKTAKFNKKKDNVFLSGKEK